MARTPVSRRATSSVTPPPSLSCVVLPLLRLLQLDLPLRDLLLPYTGGPRWSPWLETGVFLSFED